MDIRQCKRCNKVYMYTGNPICPDCIKHLDQKFIEVRDYLYENPNVGIEEVCENTDCDVQTVHRWLREGRLLLHSNTAPLLRCTKCGAPIHTGQMCEKCTNKMRSDFKGAADLMKPPPETFKAKEDGRMHVEIRKK